MNGGGALPESTRPPDLEPAINPYAVLKNRDFLLYLSGRFIASFGQQMLAVTVGWEIYERTHSKLALGIVGLVQMVPMFLFIFPAGHVADNYNRKKVIVWMQLLFGSACAGLTLVSGFIAACSSWAPREHTSGRRALPSCRSRCRAANLRRP